jgi:hypothetical protein
MKRHLRTYSAQACTLLAAIALLSGSPATLRADDAKDTKAEVKKEEPKKKKWESTATVGVTLSRGNSKNFLATGAVGTKRTWDCNEILAGAIAGYGDNTITQSDGTKTNTLTDSYIRGFGQWNHLFTPRIYGGLRLSAEHDDVAHVTYRTIVSPLAGYYFIKQTNTFLSAEIGPSYVHENLWDTTNTDGTRNDNVNDYIGLRLAERGEYKWASGAKIWESIEFIPKFSDFSDYLVNAECGVSAPVTKALSVSLVLQDTYRSVPASGRLKNDLKLIAGLTYNF